MTFDEFLNNYLGYIWETFMYDTQVFSKPWLYYWLLIPAFGYFIFFLIKWSILLLPIWMPLNYLKKVIKKTVKTLHKFRR